MTSSRVLIGGAARSGKSCIALVPRFRDEAGRLHPRLAESCDEIYFAACGCMLRLAPAPLELVR